LRISRREDAGMDILHDLKKRLWCKFENRPGFPEFCKPKQKRSKIGSTFALWEWTAFQQQQFAIFRNTAPIFLKRWVTNLREDLARFCVWQRNFHFRSNDSCSNMNLLAQSCEIEIVDRPHWMDFQRSLVITFSIDRFFPQRLGFSDNNDFRYETDRTWHDPESDKSDDRCKSKFPICERWKSIQHCDSCKTNS
jgi:hypothetical protein